MTYPKLCRECRWAVEDSERPWALRCANPHVNGRDAWALSSGRTVAPGTDTASERQKGWWGGVCGMRGAKWEGRDT